MIGRHRTGAWSAVALWLFLASGGRAHASSPEGEILREWWEGIAGIAVANLTGNVNYPGNPTGSGYPTIFEGPVHWADNYGTRFRGYVHPPQTGDYIFWVSSDETSELWLSTDEDPGNAVMIASESAWSGSRVWQTGAEQSAPIALVAGERYYIEALHKEGGGGDNIAVGWQLPDATFERPIPGSRLSPWNDAAPPTITSVTGDDPDDGDTVYGADDTITIMFNRNTNQSAAAAGMKTGAEMNSLFTLSAGHTFGGASDTYSLTWTDARTLTITVLAGVTATVDIGDTITILAAADIQNAAESSGPGTDTSGPMTGDWGDVPPTITRVVPQDGEEDVSPSTTVNIYFNKPMDETSTPAAFSMDDADGVSIPGTKELSANGIVLTFTPDAALVYEETYTVVVAATAEDLAGNALGADHVFSFDTASKGALGLIGTGCAPLGGAPQFGLSGLLLAFIAAFAAQRAGRRRFRTSRRV